MNNQPPRAAYVHVPFCRHRCGYCNFTLVAQRDDLIETYLRAIERELSWLDEPREVDTLFIGGGTPTHLTPDQLWRLLALVRHWFPLADNYEFSVEANPADLDVEKTKVLSEKGVTRISLGAQSFNDQKLYLLERDHHAVDIRHAFQLARDHVRSVSIDMIFGVPNETFDIWQTDLATALDLGPDHISTYGLTFERGTTFWNRLAKDDLNQVDEQLERDMYETAIDTLTDAGFKHYEVSNFARPGHQCRQNEVYWLGQQYYAVGPSASRYVDGRRETNHRSTTTYLKRVLADQTPVAEREQLSPEDAAREKLVFGLRRLDGIDRDKFAAETGFQIDELVNGALTKFLEQGLLEWSKSTLRLTRNGLIVSDSLWPDFLAAESQNVSAE